MKRTFTFLLTALFLCVGMVKAAVTDVPEMSTEGSIKWYTISNTRSTSGRYLYWTENGVKDSNTLTGASLFYFTAGVGDSCFIHNAATELLFTGSGAWNAEGVGCVISETPHSSKAGVAIEFNGTSLNEQNYADGFTTWSANDAGSIFVISPATASLEAAIAKMEENKAAGNTILGLYKYEEEVYNKLVATLETLNTATGDEIVTAFESAIATLADLPYVMPEEGKFYVIECPLFAQVQGVSKGLSSTPGWNTLDLTDTNYYWTVEVNNGAYALKNVGTGTYLGGTTMSETAVSVALNPLGEQQFNIVAGGTTVHANNHGGGAGASGNIVSWEGSVNSASAWQFIEKADPASLVEVAVTYSFTYGGEEKFTQTTSTLVGEEWPAITVAFPYGVSASKPEGVIEVEEAAPTTFHVKNALSGKYLNFDPESNLTTADAEAVATIVPSSVVAGTYAISYPDPAGVSGVRYVQSGSSGRFSGNAALSKNSSVYLYKVTGEGTATRVEAIEDGASYIFVAESTKGGYWMLTNELYGEGADLRMIGVKVSDELPGDEITFEQGEYSPVWTIKPVEKEEETIAITKVIELEVGELPFMAAENVESIVKWYYAKMHSNYPKYIEENAEGGINWVKATVDEHKTDSLLWGFVGNVFDGIKLVNKATGHAVVSTGGDAKMGDAANATALILSASAAGVENGFCLKYPDSNNFLNAQGTKVASWSAADAGSTFLLEEYVEVAELTVLGAKVGDVDIVDGTATVSSISTIDVIFDRPVALAENAGWATVTDEWGENSLKAEVLAENNCVVRFSLQWGLVIAEEGDFPFYVPEGLIIGAEDANYINAEITATITVEAAPATPLTVTNVTVGEDVMEGFTAVATPEDMIKVNFDGQFYFQGMPSIIDAEGNDASEYFQFMNGMDVDGSNSYIFMAQNWQGTAAPAGIYTITLAKASFMEMMSYKAPAEDIVLTVQIIAGGEFVEVTEVSLNTTWGELNEVGATLQLTATVTPENATEQAITWSSSHPDIVTVSEDGLVTVVAAAMEQVEIKATAANGVSASCWLTVYVIEPGAVTGIKLNATWKDLEVKSGDTFQLVATVEPEDATDKTVTWSSSADFAVVDANGLVTFTGTPEDGGVVTITATASNGMTATCMLSVTFVDNADGIDNINADAETVIYDIHGRRVTEMTKGVYIVNGKKVIKK